MFRVLRRKQPKQVSKHHNRSFSYHNSRSYLRKPPYYRVFLMYVLILSWQWFFFYACCSFRHNYDNRKGMVPYNETTSTSMILHYKPDVVLANIFWVWNKTQKKFILILIQMSWPSASASLSVCVYIRSPFLFSTRSSEREQICQENLGMVRT